MAPPFRPRLQTATDENAFPKTRRIGRAEALRRSIAALIAKGAAAYAHPSVWAPFVLVGNGPREQDAYVKNTERFCTLPASHAP
jgi:hypothetical protein